MKRIFINVVMVSLVVVSSPLQAACNAAMVESKPDSVLRNNGDGTVTDKETGLVWMQCSEGQSGADCAGSPASQFTWDQALAQVQTANAAVANGYSDWRLPSVAELGSLVEYACSSPAINSNRFPLTQSLSYWTSSPSVNADDSAWRVSFSEGAESVDTKQSLHYVRLVRN